MLKNFRELKNQSGNYAVVVDCLDSVEMEEQIISLRSIFSSTSKNTEFVFAVKRNSDLSILETLIEAMYEKVHRAPPSNLVLVVDGEDGVDEFNSLLSKEVNRIKSKYVVFVKLGTIVNGTTFSKLLFSLNNYNEYYKQGIPGLVVPLINGKVGNQHLSMPNELQENDIDSINNKLIDLFTNSDRAKWVLTGICSDVCYVLTRDVIDKIGIPSFLLKARTNATTMMSEYIATLLENGFLSLIAGDTYVYFPKPETRLQSNFLPIKLDSTEVKKKLGVLYKIHITSERQREVFVKSIKQVVEFADFIHIIDVSSKLPISPYMRENFEDVWSKIISYEKVFSSTDDKRDYNKLLGLSEEDGCDWVLMLDGTETFPDSVNRASFDKLMNPPNQFVFGYALSEFYMWDDNNWRYDSIWINSCSVRLCRLLPGRKIVGQGNLASQSGYVPVLPKEYIRFCNIPLQMWSFSSPEERDSYSEYVKSVEPSQDWGYFKDEKTLSLHKFTTGKITTFSPIGKGGPLLEDWLDHVWSWSDRILLGNDRKQLSEEDLDVITKKYGGKVVDCDMSSDFGKGRNMILDYVTTDYVMQLDIDERVTDSRVLQRLVASPNDAFMFTIENLQKGDNPVVVTNTVRLFKILGGRVRYWGYLHETIDDAVRKNKMRLTHSPVKLLHYGYLWANPEASYKKMQRYIGLNMKQIEDFPDDPRAYYNLAMHVLEDGIFDSALRLLNVCIMISKGSFLLPVIELTKVHLLKTLQLCTHLRQSNEQMIGGREAIQFANQVAGTVRQIISHPIRVAPNHAANYFQVDKEAARKLSDMLLNIEKKLNMI